MPRRTKKEKPNLEKVSQETKPNPPKIINIEDELRQLSDLPESKIENQPFRCRVCKHLTAKAIILGCEQKCSKLNSKDFKYDDLFNGFIFDKNLSPHVLNQCAVCGEDMLPQIGAVKPVICKFCKISLSEKNSAKNYKS
jgi:hypothetical protein